MLFNCILKILQEESHTIGLLSTQLFGCMVRKNSFIRLELFVHMFFFIRSSGFDFNGPVSLQVTGW